MYHSSGPTEPNIHTHSSSFINKSIEIKYSPAQLMEIGVTTGLGQHVRNIAEQVARLEKEPATTLLQLLEGETVGVTLKNREIATLIHVQVKNCSYSLKHIKKIKQ